VTSQAGVCLPDGRHLVLDLPPPVLFLPVHGSNPGSRPADLGLVPHTQGEPF
jgi:hypothetical protein